MSNTSAIPGFSTPAAGPEAPLEMLAVCHQRGARQCATLRRLVPHLAATGGDEQTRSAATSVMRYFDKSAVDHFADEERDLFPALLESMAGSDAVCLREMIAGLTADHRDLEAAWLRARAVLVQVAAGEPAPRAAQAIDALVTRYERHMAREDDELMPMAARLLGQAALENIGRAMRERRGIDGPKRS